jgi:vacuolar-type H+-ATPase subunit I/STV1
MKSLLLLALSSLWYYKTYKLVTGTKKLAKGWVSNSVWANENEIFFTQKKDFICLVFFLAKSLSYHYQRY